MATRVTGNGPMLSVLLPYAGSFAVNMYDMIVLNTATAKLASALTDQLTQAENQAFGGPQFVGISLEAKLSTDPAGTIKVGLIPQVIMACTSETHAIGELLAMVEQGNGTQLEDAKLIKTTDPTAAIGCVIRTDTSAATTVQAQLFTRSIGSGVQPPPFPMAVQQALSGAGAISVATYHTSLTTTGAAQALTLANGKYVGQRKKITHAVDGGSAVLTPTSLSGGTTITFTTVGEYAELIWNGSAWVAVVLANTATPGTLPALA